MNEAEARRVFSEPENNWPYRACVEADRWMKQYAIREFELRMRQNAIPKPMREFMRSCVQAHFGSIEADKMLKELKCYPDWL